MNLEQHIIQLQKNMKLLTIFFNLKIINVEQQLKEVTAAKGKALSPYGSKSLVLNIETSYFTYDYIIIDKKEDYFIKPNTSFSLRLEGYEEMPKDRKYTYPEGANKKVYTTFDYIIDGKFSVVCTFDGWFEYEGKQETSSIYLNGWLSKYFQNQNYEFIERVKLEISYT